MIGGGGLYSLWFISTSQINDIENLNCTLSTIGVSYQNVRELQNIISGAYFLCETHKITQELLPIKLLKKSSKNTIGNKTESVNNLPNYNTLENAEKDMIIKAIEKCNGNITRTAKLLNIGKATVYRKIKKYNINFRENKKSVSF